MDRNNENIDWFISFILSATDEKGAMSAHARAKIISKLLQTMVVCFC
jgi:hypothetical protein